MTTPTPRTYTQEDMDRVLSDLNAAIHHQLAMKVQHERDLAAAQEDRQAAEQKLADERAMHGLTIKRADEAQEARQAAEALAAQNAKEAENWRLMFGSARVSAVGSAGLGGKSEGNYAHLCLNFWTTHEPATGVEPLAQEWIDGYLAKARAAIAGDKP